MQGSRGYHWSSRQRRSWEAGRQERPTPVSPGRESMGGRPQALLGVDPELLPRILHEPPSASLLGLFSPTLTCSLSTTFPRKSSWPLSFRASLKILSQAGYMRETGQEPEGVRLGSADYLRPSGRTEPAAQQPVYMTGEGKRSPQAFSGDPAAFTFAARADL